MKSLSTDSLLAKMLAWLAVAVCRHPRRFVYPQVALVAASIAVTVGFLQFDMNQNDLVGPNLKYHKNYLELQKEFPHQGSDLVVVVESDNLEKNRQFMERLAARMAPETNLFRNIFYQQDFAALGTKALFFIPTNDLTSIQSKLQDGLPFRPGQHGVPHHAAADECANRIAVAGVAGADAHPDAGHGGDGDAGHSSVAGRGGVVRRRQRDERLHHVERGADFSADDTRVQR
jgi:hypothetical protein